MVETRSRPTPAPDWPHPSASRFVESGKIRWHVQVMGAGPVLLLVHGTGASTHSFRALMPLLAERFTVVAPDLPGHAFSQAPVWFEPTVPAIAAALDGLLDTLDLGRPDVAIGHSAGAALVARMTLDRSIAPRLLVGLAAALVPFRGMARALFPRSARLLELASRVVDMRVRDRMLVERFLRSTGSSLDREGVELYLRLATRPGHVTAVLAMMASWDLDALFAELPDLDVPLLLLAGAADRAVPMDAQRAVAARAPRARVVVVPASGHLLHEEHPNQVAALILGELDGQGRASV